MIVVHHLENSRSQRILWLLEELGLPYEVRRYERDRKTMLAPRELRRVHPLGKSPVLEDEGRAIAETGAIVEYLVDKADGRLGPPAKRDDRLRYRHFLHYAEGSMMPPLLAMLVVRRLGLAIEEQVAAIGPNEKIGEAFALRAQQAGPEWKRAADVVGHQALEEIAHAFAREADDSAVGQGGGGHRH